MGFGTEGLTEPGHRDLWGSLSVARQFRMTVAGCGVVSGTEAIATTRCPSGVTAYERPTPRRPPAPGIVKSACGTPIDSLDVSADGLPSALAT